MFGTKRGETEKRGREKPDIPRECCLKRKKAPSKSRKSVKPTVSIDDNSTSTPPPPRQSKFLFIKRLWV